MPELPEVQTVANELNRKLKNRRIVSVQVTAPKLVSVGPGVLSPKRKASKSGVTGFVKLLQGQRFLSVKRRAKLLIFDLSPTSPSTAAKAMADKRLRRTGGPLSLLVHLKMTGQFIFEDRKLRKKTGGWYRLFNTLTAPKVFLPGKHTHVIFTFAKGAHLYFNDVRKFGYLKLVKDGELDQVRELREFGPEPLDKKFTLEVFQSILAKRGSAKIKQALTDPKIVAGIGNIYSDEILFHAKVRPARLVKSLSPKELSAVFKSIKPVLLKGIAAKGSSVGEYVRTDGSWGQMGKFHFVYGRKGQKCKVCGTTIQAVKLGGRTGSFCPKCQR